MFHASRARDGRRRFAVARVLWLKSLFSREPVRWCGRRGAWKQACGELGRHLHLTERGSNRQSAIGARSRGSATMVILDRRDVPAWSAPQKHARAFRGFATGGDVMRRMWGRFVHVFLLMTLMLVPTGAHRLAPVTIPLPTPIEWTVPKTAFVSFVALTFSSVLPSHSRSWIRGPRG